MMLYKYANKHTNQSKCESYALQTMLTIATVTDESSLPKNLMLNFSHYIYIKFTHVPIPLWPDQDSGQVRLAHTVL